MPAPEGAEHHVVREVHVGDQTHAEAVFRDKGERDAHLGDRKGILADELFAGPVVFNVADAAGLHGLQPGDGLQQLLLAAAGNAGNAEDLPGIRRKGDVVQLQDTVDAAHRQAFDLDARLRVHRVRPVDVQGDGVPDHHVGHFLGVGLGGRHVADELPVAQDGHAVGERLHLVHFVGDDDNGLSVVAHVAQHGKELIGLLGSEHGRGLVQNQDVCAAVEDLDDLNGLLLGNRHVVDLLVRVHLKAVGVADRADLLGSGLQVEFPLEAEHNVLRGGQHVDQLEVLVDHPDAQVKGVLGRADDDVLPVDGNRPLVGEVDARKHVHQGGFAAAVFPEQGKDFPAVDVQPDFVVSQDRAETLGDIPHFYCGDLVVQGRHTPYTP